MSEKDPIWYRGLDRFGVAVLALIFIGFCVLQFGRWLAPQVERIIDGHVDFMRRTADSGAKNAKAVEDSGLVQKQISEAIQEIKKVEQLQTDHSRESLEMQREVLDELKRAKTTSPQSFITPNNIPFVLHQSQ